MSGSERDRWKSFPALHSVQTNSLFPRNDQYLGLLLSWQCLFRGKENTFRKRDSFQTNSLFLGMACIMDFYSRDTVSLKERENTFGERAREDKLFRAALSSNEFVFFSKNGPNIRLFKSLN